MIKRNHFEVIFCMREKINVSDENSPSPSPKILMFWYLVIFQEVGLVENFEAPLLYKFYLYG